MAKSKIGIEINEEFDSVEDMSVALEHIANLLSQGFTSGIDPDWETK